MACVAVAVRSGEGCKNDAEMGPLCVLHGTRLLEGRSVVLQDGHSSAIVKAAVKGAATWPEAWAEADSASSKTPQDSTPADVDAAPGPPAPVDDPADDPREPSADLFDLPAAPDLSVDPMAMGEGAADHVRDLGALDRAAAAVLDDDGPDDAGEVAPSPPPRSAAPPGDSRVVGWKRHAGRVLRGPVQAKLRRDGVAPLEADELDVGQDVLGEALAEAFKRADPNNPYGALVLWAVATFAPRYAGRIAPGRKRPPAAAAAEAAEAEAPEPDNAPRGGAWDSILAGAP